MSMTSFYLQQGVINCAYDKYISILWQDQCHKRNDKNLLSRISTLVGLVDFVACPSLEESAQTYASESGFGCRNQ